LYFADAHCTATGTTAIVWVVPWLTSAEFEDDVSPPNVASAMTASPPPPPFPPLPSFAFSPPSAEEPVRAADPALPLPPSAAVVPLPARLVPSAELSPPGVDDVDVPPLSLAVRLPVSPLVLLGSDVEVAGAPVAEVVDAPPVADDVPEAVDVPPLALAELEFEPEPPAPPVRSIVNSLIAPLIWPTVLEVVLVLLPEFVPDELFDCEVSP